MKQRITTVNDTMQKKYQYVCSEAVGENFHPLFKPELTPKEMLALGVFGGKYMRDCTDEFPVAWFAEAKFSCDGYDKNLNFFHVRASQSLKQWRQKGWIHQDDPRGWFQWYCRYYMGRRGEDDARQIKRWRAFTRHYMAVKNNCFPYDFSCRTRQRQALLHWAYDSRKI